ncbi:MAG: tetratricopeptide repeat protein [Candidatus Gastranaerophilales bacterium]|nr:tetratricopeptide repeat protein [Candidatus Gastranaerophilales bacterium]
MITRIIFILLITTCLTSAYVRPDTYKIDAQKNAVIHNNKGINSLAEGNYAEAIQEFSLAILINPKTQATAVYYNNLGETYMKLGQYRNAQGCFEKSVKQYNLNFLYYQNLVKSFKGQGIIKTKIKVYETKSDKNPMNMLMLGLLYVHNGDIRRGIIKLDEFCMREPDLLITPSVRSYIQILVNSKDKK